MSLERRCDICDGSGYWQIRKRWKIFRWYCNGFDAWSDELDVCDKCIEKFREWRQKQKRRK